MKKTPCRLCRTHRCRHKRGGRLRAKTLTPAHQRMATLCHTLATRQRIGKLGFAALASKRGVLYAAEQVARWRRTHPSGLERTVMGWLDELREPYEHDQPFEGMAIYPDLQLPARRLVIEVDGRGFHLRTEWLSSYDRAARDAAKDAIYRKAGYRVLRLCERCVRDRTGYQLLLKTLEGQSK